MSSPLRQDAQRLFQQESWQELSRLLQTLANLPDQPAWVYQYFGAALFHCQDYGKAERSLRQALDQEPKQGWTYFYLGRTLAAKEETNEAEKHLQTANKYLPDQLWPALFLIELLLKSRKIDEASKIFLQSYNQFPGNTHLVSLAKREQSLSVLLEQTGRISGNIEYLIKFSNGQLLITGWSKSSTPDELIMAIWCGQELEVKTITTGIPRADIAQSHGLTNDDLGFILAAEIPSPKLNRAVNIYWQNEAISIPLTLLEQEQWPQNAETLLRYLHLQSLPASQACAIFDAGIGKALLQLQLLAPKSLYKENFIKSQYNYGPTPKQAAEVSVIVPLYARWDLAITQLMAFSRDSWFASGRAELIYIVDDPRISQAFQSWAASLGTHLEVPFRIITLTRNFGYATATNIGIENSNAAYCCLLNSDVFPISALWLQPLLKELQDNEKVGAVGPLLLYPDKSVQHAGMIYAETAEIPGLRLNQHPHKGLHWEGGDQPLRVQALTGAAMLIKRSRYQSLGGLSNRFIRGDFEDSSLCEQLQNLGLSCLLVPDVKLLHAERQSFLGREPDDGASLWRVLANAWLAKFPTDAIKA